MKTNQIDRATAISTLIEDIASSNRLLHSKSYTIHPDTRRLTKQAKREYDALNAVAEAAHKLKRANDETLPNTIIARTKELDESLANLAALRKES